MDDLDLGFDRRGIEVVLQLGCRLLIREFAAQPPRDLLPGCACGPEVVDPTVPWL